MTGIVSLVLGTAGNLAMFGVFLAALRLPAASSAFLRDGGWMIFLFEFLELHVAGIFAKSGKPKRLHTRSALATFYTAFAVAVGILFQNWFLPAYFAASTVVKAAEQRAIADARRIGLALIALILSTILAALIGGDALIAVWGTIYFPAIILIDVVLFFHRR